MTRLEQLEAARRKLPLEGEASSRADRWSRATGERGRRRLGFGLRSAQSAARKGAGLRSGRSQGASSLSNQWEIYLGDLGNCQSVLTRTTLAWWQ